MIRNQWPKIILPLTSEQKEIADDFMKYWHEVLPKKYGIVEKFNHGFSKKNKPKLDHCKTLEIGAGLGEHLFYEELSNQEYYCLELRENMANEIKKNHPVVRAVVGDCQEKLNFPNEFFDRIIAIHVLEHLPNLPAAIKECCRLLKPNGQFEIVIPCDPGFLYKTARMISAERIFKKRYNQPYGWFISREHINSPKEILNEVKKLFVIQKKSFFPFKVSLVNFNLCIGMILKKQ